MTAVISTCGQYRYQLRRTVDEELAHRLPTVAFFGVNPSTADAERDDPTVRKWLGFAERYKFGTLLVGNVFAYRATDVKRLAGVADPIGPENAQHLASIIQQADILIPCWGARAKLPKALHRHLDEFAALLRCSSKPAYAWGFTLSGDPLHPQYLPYTTPLVQFKA